MSKYGCVIFAVTIFLVSASTEHPKEPHAAKTHKTHTENRQHVKPKIHRRSQYRNYPNIPQKCHIVCPNYGNNIDLPPNFLTNCSNYHRPNQGNQPSTIPTVPTTTKSTSTTLQTTTLNSTSDEDVESTEDEDESTESPQNGTDITTGRTRTARREDKFGLRKHDKQKKIHTKNIKKTRKWKKVTVKNSKGKKLAKYRMSLSGCHVVCSDLGYTGGGATNIAEGTDFDGEDDDDDDDGPYEIGEDLPLEYTAAPRPLFPLAEIDFLNFADDFADPFFFPYSERKRRTSQSRKKQHLSNKNHNKKT